MKYIPPDINHSAFRYGGGAKKRRRPESYDTFRILSRAIHLDALGQRKSAGNPRGIVGEETVDETHLVDNEEAEGETYEP